MDSTHETPRMTIEQNFATQDQEIRLLNHLGDGDDGYDHWDGQFTYDDDNWDYDWDYGWDYGWGNHGGDDADLSDVRPVIREVSGEEWFLNNVVEKRLVGAKSIPHDLWVCVIVPLAISKKKKKLP